MNPRITLAGMLAMILTVSGCVKSGHNTSDVKLTNNVVLKVAIPAVDVTRGEGDRVRSDAVTLAEGHILFADASGVIRRYVQVKNSASGVDEVSLSDVRSSSGATVTGVPTSVDKCYIFANVPSSVSVSVTEGMTKISDIQALTMAVGDMADASCGVSKVPQWGEGAVGYDAVQSKYTTEVRLEAMGARLQVVKLSAKASGGKTIKSYRVDGIFVNNFFASTPVGYDLIPSDITDNKSDAAKYGGASNIYTSGIGCLADFNAGFAAGLGRFDGAQTTVCTPAGDDKVWAYNVWPTHGITGADASTVPHIVIRLSEVVWNDGTTDHNEAGQRFVTVRSIRQDGNALNCITNGKAYTFADIAFGYDDLALVPEEVVVSVEVSVEEIDWEEIDVEAGL